MIPEHIFRAYDIRGVYGVDLTEEVASRIGRAVSAHFNGKEKNVAVGRDVRLSGGSLEDALIEGLLSGGCNVEDIGMVTTPILYFSSAHYEKDAGVMVTASHNPPEWNGFKIWTKDGFICEGRGIEDIKKTVIDGRFKDFPSGKLERNTQALINYEDYVLRKIGINRRLRGVFDPGNGSCSLLVPELYENAGIEVVALNAEPDGRFPKHPPEPTVEALDELVKVVLTKKADFGVGFDGDGDRCVFVDDKGRIAPSNSILVILAEHYLKEQEGAPIVYEVSCSMRVEEVIKLHGGKPVLSRVGHTYIYENVIDAKAAFGGESSGHFYFGELYGFDDALFTCLKLAEVLSERDEKFSDIVDSIPIYPRVSKNFNCPDEMKFKVVRALKEEFVEAGSQVLAIDGVKVIVPEGWFLIRPSNTQPQIRLTVESRTKKDLENLARFAERKLLEKIQS